MIDGRSSLIASVVCGCHLSGNECFRLMLLVSGMNHHVTSHLHCPCRFSAVIWTLTFSAIPTFSSACEVTCVIIGQSNCFCYSLTYMQWNLKCKTLSSIHVLQRSLGDSFSCVSTYYRSRHRPVHCRNPWQTPSEFRHQLSMASFPTAMKMSSRLVGICGDPFAPAGQLRLPASAGDQLVTRVDEVQRCCWQLFWDQADRE